MAGSWSGLMKIYLGRKKETNERLSKTSHRLSLSGPATKLVARYMPSYRLDAHNPLNREQCEKIMKAVMDKAFEDFIFSSKQAQDLCQHISEEIKTRIKERNYDRYRLVCVVTIGEKCMQGFKSVVTFLWDAEKDGYINHFVNHEKLFPENYEEMRPPSPDSNRSPG